VGIGKSARLQRAPEFISLTASGALTNSAISIPLSDACGGSGLVPSLGPGWTSPLSHSLDIVACDRYGPSAGMSMSKVKLSEDESQRETDLVPYLNSMRPTFVRYQRLILG
jgi:hypothetical protein